MSELIEDLEYRKILKRAIETEEEKLNEREENIEEDKCDEDSAFPIIGFDYSDVQVAPAKLTKLVESGHVDIKYSSGSRPTVYELRDREKIKELLETYEHTTQQEDVPIEDVEVDLSAFDKLIEVRDVDKKVKRVMHRATKDPGIHVALIGGPGTGKSLIASCIEKSTRSTWISGTDMTKASIRNELIETKPRFVIVDELDKYSSKEAVQILSEPMEDQTLTTQVSGKEAERVEMPINVFATANEWNLPSNIEDRFLPLRLREYTDGEFRELVLTGFTKNEGINRDIVEEVVDRALSLSPPMKSYRRCLQVSKLCDEPNDVEWIFSTFDFGEGM